jgi:hypothetical protein
MEEITEQPQARRGWRGLKEWYRARIAASTEVTPALETVAAAMTAAGYPDGDVVAVRVALEAALVHAIGQGPPGVARLNCWGNADEVVATVVGRDGFCPALSLPGGHATSLTVNARGNGLVIRRQRSAG